jgi:gas vesicle protein
MSANDELAPPAAVGVPADEDPEKIRADIERTRAQMSETIGAIQDKLRPEDLKNQAVQQLQEVKEKLKEELREQIDEIKDKVKEEIREAKDKFREATVGKVEDMVHNATDKVEHAGESFVETVRANPIPVALVGIGVAWLLMNRRSARALPRANYRYAGRRDDRYADGRPSGSGNYLYADEVAGSDYDPRYGRDDLRTYEEQGRLARLQERAGEVVHRAQNSVNEAVHQVGDKTRDVAHQVSDKTREVAHQVSDKTREMAHQVGDKTRDAAHRAQDTAHDLADRARGAAHRAQHAASDLAVRARGTADDLAERARYGVRRAEDRVQSTYETNPLALGAMALLAGVAVGLALPRTQREDRLMGQARDKLVQRAQEAAHETMEKVQGAVSEKIQNGVSRENHSNHVSANSV